MPPHPHYRPRICWRVAQCYGNRRCKTPLFDLFCFTFCQESQQLEKLKHEIAKLPGANQGMLRTICQLAYLLFCFPSPCFFDCVRYQTYLNSRLNRMDMPALVIMWSGNIIRFSPKVIEVGIYTLTSQRRRGRRVLHLVPQI